MCSLIFTSETEKARMLATLNSYRGTHSHSIFYVNGNTLQLVGMHKMLGPLDLTHIDIPRDCVAIIHQQAPTTKNKNLHSVHPSTLDFNDYLWHNGILKDKTCDELRETFDTSQHWDTELLHIAIADDGYNSLDEIDGSFACIRFIESESIHFFRNEISPLYSDGEALSSTPFDEAFAVNPNQVFEAKEFHEGMFRFNLIHEFRTSHNPYYFGE